MKVVNLTGFTVLCEESAMSVKQTIKIVVCYGIMAVEFGRLAST